MSFRKIYLLFLSYSFYNKLTFIRKMHGGKVLDIGCGNHSPYTFKLVNPSVYYVGTDIDKYNIDDRDIKAADEIHFFDVDVFFEKLITDIDYKFDYIICAHLIEHLPDKDIFFRAIKNKLGPNGKCFINTPNIKSVNFPSARRTLNYYDDPTHLEMPVILPVIYDLCVKYDLKITKLNSPNRSYLSYILGFCVEPLRIIMNKNIQFTWSYWGFEDLYIIENK